MSTCRSSLRAELRRAPSASSMRTIAGAGQARRHPRSARPRAGHERRRRLDLRRAVRRSRTSSDGRTRCAARSATARNASGRRCSSGFGKQRPFRLRPPAGLARRGAARRGARARRHRLHQGKPPLLSRTRSSRRICSATSASTTTGLSGIESAYDSQIRGKDGDGPRQTDARRHVFSRFERPPTSGSIDRADHRRVPAAHRRARAARRRASRTAPPAAPPSSWIRATGEILAMANEPTFNPNAYRRFARKSSGATAPCRISTSPARRSRSSRRRRRSKSGSCRSTRIDRHQLRASSASATASSTSTRPQLRRAVVQRRDRQVEQRRRDQDRLQARHRAAEPATCSGSDSAGRSRPTSPARAPASSGARDKWTESALASVSMGYQVGVTPLQMAAAVELDRQRRRATSSRASSARCIATTAATPSSRRSLRRTISRDTAATLTDDHGRRRRGRHREGSRRFHGYTSRARPARRRS